MKEHRSPASVSETAKMQSAERVSQVDASDNYVFQRSILAYYQAAQMVSGDVLEVGTGSGYGVAVIAPHSQHFVTIDKTLPPVDTITGDNVEFRQMSIPPLVGIDDESYDYVISFQVIEHIRRDRDAIREMYRVLRPGGRLIISTPNKKMSLTRNPWHVREYTVEQFRALLSAEFADVEAMGVFGNGKVAAYYEKNKASVRAVMKYDVLRMQRWLPRWVLRIPYDIMNRRNRRRLLTQNTELTSSITMDDYRIASADDSCYDLFFVARK